MNLYKKRTDYWVIVKKPPIGSEHENWLEKNKFKITEERPYMITGVLGEHWPVSKERLIATYNVENSMDVIEKGFPVLVNPKLSDEIISAQKIDEDVEIITEYGDKLQGRKGNYLAYAYENGEENKLKPKVIDARVFDKTYKRVDEN